MVRCVPYVGCVIEIVSWNVNRRPLWLKAPSGLPWADIGLFQEAPRPSGTEVLEFIPCAEGPWATAHWRGELRTCIARYSDAVQLEPVSLRASEDESDYSALGVSRAEPSRWPTCCATAASGSPSCPHTVLGRPLPAETSPCSPTHQHTASCQTSLFWSRGDEANAFSSRGT